MEALGPFAEWAHLKPKAWPGPATPPLILEGQEKLPVAALNKNELKTVI